MSVRDLKKNDSLVANSPIYTNRNAQSLIIADKMLLNIVQNSNDPEFVKSQYEKQLSAQPAWIRLLLSPELTSEQRRKLGHYKTELQIGRKFSLIGAFFMVGLIKISNQVYSKKAVFLLQGVAFGMLLFTHEIKRNAQKNWFLNSGLSQKLDEFQAENQETETDSYNRLSQVLNFVQTRQN